MKKPINVSLTALLAAGVILGAAACGGGAKADSNEPAPAATEAKAPAQAAAPTATVAAAAPIAPTLVASNLLFDKKELTAKAGSVTIEIDNRDASVPHNLHVFSGTDATGTSVGKTEVEAGPVKQSLTVTLAKGSYFFQCDVHPTTMTGTITVE